MRLTEDRKVLPPPKKTCGKPPCNPLAPIVPLPSQPRRPAEPLVAVWWVWCLSSHPAWDDGREGAVHDVQEQERGRPQRQPGEGKVSPKSSSSQACIDLLLLLLWKLTLHPKLPVCDTCSWITTPAHHHNILKLKLKFYLFLWKIAQNSEP